MRLIVLSIFCITIHFNCFGNELDKLYEQARSYWNKDWITCINLLEKALPIAEKEVGKEDDFYAVLLNDLAVAYWHIGKLDKAENLLNQAIEIELANYGDQSAQYAASIVNAAGIYHSLGSLSRAQDLYTKAINIYENLAQSSSEYIAALNSYGSFLEKNGKYFQAEELFFTSLDEAEVGFGKESDEYASALNNLGNLYIKTGLYEEAKNYLSKAIAILSKNPNAHVGEYTDALSNMGLLHETLGNYAEAEKEYLQVLKIRENTMPLSSEHAQALGNLAVHYQNVGNFEEAENYFLESREIYKQSLGENHPDYGVATNNLAEFYKLTGNFEASEKLYLEASEIFRLSYSDMHPLYSTSLNNLASLYRRKGHFEKALELYNKTLSIDEVTLGKDHPVYATSLNNVALLYFSMGKPEQAEPLFKQALEIRRQKLGSQHPAYSRSLSNLALFYLSQEKIAEAEPLFVESIKSQLRQIRTLFPSLSEKEKEDYYNTIREDVERFNTIAVLRSSSNPAILGEMYNSQLATKAILFNASDKMRRSILSSGDQNLIDDFNKWRNLKSDLAKYYQFSVDELRAQNIDLSIFERVANDLEKSLSQRSAVFASQFDAQQKGWKDIQRVLGEDEAAVEIIRFREFRSSKEGRRFGFADNVYYAALVLTSETTTAPKLVLLTNGNELESKYFAYFRNAFRFRVEDWYSYDQFWTRIEKELAGKNKIYLSPDGVYHKINLNALLDIKTGKYLIDKVNIQLVTNTSDILETEVIENNSREVVLLGNPDFMIDPPTRKRIVKDQFSESHNVDAHSYEHLRDIQFGRQYLEDLPGSEEEIEQVVEVIQKENWQERVYLGANALEEVVKDVYRPKILHIATHGFFSESQLSQGYIQGVSSENPLFKSGLMLSGSGNTLYRKEAGMALSRDVEDGILTAYEAMNLDLDGTELVVLSACETGLGDVKNGEGVYGLERAFKVAGAEAIVLSLFKVDDFATKALMTLFYQEWISSDDKWLAFKRAQLKFRESYPDPYYWAPFLMVGD